MSYAHSLGGVDLDKLTGIGGSKNESIIDELVASLGDELEDNDEFLEDEIEDGDCPSTEDALRQMLPITAKRCSWLLIEACPLFRFGIEADRPVGRPVAEGHLR